MTLNYICTSVIPRKRDEIKYSILNFSSQRKIVYQFMKMYLQKYILAIGIFLVSYQGQCRGKRVKRIVGGNAIESEGTEKLAS